MGQKWEEQGSSSRCTLVLLELALGGCCNHLRTLDSSLLPPSKVDSASDPPGSLQRPRASG